MTTRLYFRSGTPVEGTGLPSGSKSATTANWSAGGATTNRRLDLAAGTWQAPALSGTTLGVTSAQTGLLGMFVSPPLSGAQTVGGGSITLNVADAQSNINAAFAVNTLCAYVWRPSTGTKVGNIRDAASTSLGGSPASSASSEQVTNITGITSSAVSAADGDVIVCELWAAFTQTAATAYTASLYFDGAVVTTTENTVVSNQASYIEFAETLTFGSAAVPYLLPSAPGTPSKSWKYSPSTQHVKDAPWTIPATSKSWKYSPSTQHVKALPLIGFVPVIGAPNGVVLLRQLSPTPNYTIETASETDTAYSPTSFKALTLATAFETDTTYSPTSFKALTLGTANETDTTYSPTSFKTLTLGTATDTQAAGLLSAAKAYFLGTATETDTATALASVITYLLTTATDTNTADALTSLRTYVLDTASDSELAALVSALKTYALDTAHEGDLVAALLALAPPSLTTPYIRVQQILETIRVQQILETIRVQSLTDTVRVQRAPSEIVIQSAQSPVVP